ATSFAFRPSMMVRVNASQVACLCGASIWDFQVGEDAVLVGRTPGPVSVVEARGPAPEIIFVQRGEPPALEHLRQVDLFQRAPDAGVPFTRRSSRRGTGRMTSTASPVGRRARAPSPAVGVELHGGPLAFGRVGEHAEPDLAAVVFALDAEPR